MKHILFSFILFFSPVFAAQNSCLEISNIEAYKEFDELLLLIQKNLSIMHEVARAKWNQKLPVKDVQNEKILAETLMKIAREKGLPLDFAKDFINSQIEAAKIVQTEDFDEWTFEMKSKFEHVCDLDKELRPYISSLSKRMLEKLGDIYSFIQECSCAKDFFQPPLSRRPEDQLSKEAWEKALSPFN